MQAMTQCRDGISLAPEEAARVSGVARRISFMAAILAVASFIAGSTGTSYAHAPNPNAVTLLDTIVVSNYGGGFAGTVATYLAGSRRNGRPHLRVTGTNTGLGNSSGAAHVSVSSADGHIAVAVPIDNFGGVDFKGDISGCGPFGAGTLFGTGMVEIYSPGANGNSSPENIICSPNVAFGAPNVTGIDFPQGVAFESPFDGIHPGHDILAVANNFPVVIGPDFPLGICAPPPAGGNMGLGTVTEYDITALGPGPISNVVPFNNSPVSAINPFTGAGPAPQNATIGGCLTLMLGPEEVAFDASGVLFVVNNLGSLTAASAAAPRFVTAYAPGASGDSFPLAVIGLLGPFPGCTTCPPAGILLQPVGITAASAPSFLSDEIFVTDQGDNSIKVFDPFVNFDPFTFFFQGQLIATIQGGPTRLSSPEGVTLANDDTLYVVNQTNNSVSMFADIDSIVAGGGGAVHPTLILQGRGVQLLQPVGVAVKNQFTPSSTETISARR
jgi:hypothetical protein